MARLFDDASSQYLSNANAIVTALPLTLAAWFYSDDVSVIQSLVSIADNGTTNNYYWLLLESTAVGQQIRAQTAAGGTAAIAESTGTYSANTWQHAVAVFNTTTSRTAYLDGTAGTTNTTSTAAPSGLDNTAIGRITTSSPGSYMSGRIAHAGIWNVALNANEITALAKGRHPTLVRPASLVAYWALDGDLSPEPDLHVIAGTRYNMTVNSATKANGPPVEPYSRRWWQASVLQYDEPAVGDLRFQPVWTRPNVFVGGGSF